MQLKFKCPYCNCEIKTHVSKLGDKVQCKTCFADVKVPQDANFYDPPTFDINNGVTKTKTNDKSSDVPKAKTNYPVLRTIAGFLSTLAWVSVIIGVCGIIYGLTFLGRYNDELALLIILISIVIGAVGFILSKFQAEIIYLFIDIKEDLGKIVKNTNKS